MNDNSNLHSIIMQQAETIAKLTEQLVSYVGLTAVELATTPTEAPQYAESLKGSDLVREHFRRGGGDVYCLYDDDSDEEAIEDGCAQAVVKVRPDGQFELASGNPYKYAVACSRDKQRVLTASELLG